MCRGSLFLSPPPVSGPGADPGGEAKAVVIDQNL